MTKIGSANRQQSGGGSAGKVILFGHEPMRGRLQREPVKSIMAVKLDSDS
jgi:hypothetical protein